MNCNELFEFKKIKGGYELTRFLPHKNREITEVGIPARHNGEPVVRIGEEAFYNAEFLEKVHIPDSVTGIGGSAFADSYSLERIDIPPSVKIIENLAFSRCADLREISFSEGLESIGACAFDVCEDFLRAVTLPKSLKFLGNNAFDSCWELKSVEFRNPDVRFGDDVFSNCPNLPPEIQLMSLVRSCDITRPIAESVYGRYAERHKPFGELVFMSDPLLCGTKVFGLALKNKCFREADGEDLFALLSAMIEGGLREHLQLAAEGGLLSDAELSDKLIGYSADKGRTEMTAFLLDHKNRALGYDKGEKYDL